MQLILNKGSLLKGTYFIFGFVALFLLLLTVSCVSCSSTNIPKEELMGKTKEEVLKIIFEKSPRLYNGEINIVIKPENGSFYNFYYKNIDKALADKKLMNANLWLIDSRKQFSISIFQKETSIKLSFEDNKVIKYEISIWHKT